MKTHIIARAKKTGMVVAITVLLSVISAQLPFIRVSGKSMEPTYYNDQIVRINRENQSYVRGDVVIFKQKVHFPVEEKLIKRVCGIPGDDIYCDSNGCYFIYDGKDIYYYKSNNDSVDVTELIARSTYKGTLDTDQYFCMGDNRNFSVDSRDFGAVDKSKIVACVKDGYLKPIQASREGM